ncbi:cation transporter [Neiella marina]|uniref:Cation transporter n=1 Tax=Neiella marina TaxID=508461 RepID=A0A8J2U1I1_9GAMM|nr:CDF family Co(II)/Ni(II) efflux transporter DmeF [Neiella marina]GGA63051.1 cation transporter [Neiella marina]
MHTEDLSPWLHDHSFDQQKKRTGETRTLIVIAITAVMMVVEISTGILFGSMALLADGLHMGSHAAALSITAFAYIYARRHASDTRFSFGTGKVNALGGFASAILLAIFALMMAWESVDRIINPTEIHFNEAIVVAVVGLLVNGLCVWILGKDGHDHHHHGHDHHDHHHDDHSHKHDHNLKSAYLHVMADALTSILAIVALFAAKWFGLIWMDPVMGIIGALLVAWWSIGLIRATSSVLLDCQGDKLLREQIRQGIEEVDDARVADLHLWLIGPNRYALVLAIVVHDPLPPQVYKDRLPKHPALVHVSIEVNRCLGDSRQQLYETMI